MPRAAQRRSARPLVLLALTGLLAPCAALSLRAAPMCGAARLCAPRSWAPLAAAQDDGEASPDPVAPAPAPVPVPPSPAGKSDMPTDFLGAPLPPPCPDYAHASLRRPPCARTASRRPRLLVRTRGLVPGGGAQASSMSRRPVARWARRSSSRPRSVWCSSWSSSSTPTRRRRRCLGRRGRRSDGTSCSP